MDHYEVQKYDEYFQGGTIGLDNNTARRFLSKWRHILLVVVIVFRLQVTSRIAINILKILAAMESSRKAYLVKMLITMQKAKKI